jgi:hypothetical protein
MNTELNTELNTESLITILNLNLERADAANESQNKDAAIVGLFQALASARTALALEQLLAVTVKNNEDVAKRVADYEKQVRNLIPGTHSSVSSSF